MNKNDVRTPGGAKLGERIQRGDDILLLYKAGHIIDLLSPEQVIEMITERKVAKIVYIKQ